MDLEEATLTHSPARRGGVVPLIVLLLLSMTILMPIHAVMPEPLQKQTLQGVLEWVFGDGADGKIAVDRYFLSTAQGRTELLFDAPPWHGYLGKQVVVEGTAATPRGAALSAMRVSSISLALGQRAAFATPVTGTRKIILLLVRFLGDSQEPHLPSWYTGTVINPSTGNAVNSFYLANSWGNFGWSSDATIWMTLPSPKTTYANCGWASACLDWQGLFDDAVAKGVENGVNFNLYDNIAIVTNNDLDCCAWGGSMWYNGKLYGTVWEPPWSAEQGVFAHELGHSIGLPHSGWVYHAYDSPWDVMSNGDGYNGVLCGTYFSANDGGSLSQIYCYTPAHIIAPYKDVMGWIDSAHLVTVTAGSPASVQVDTLAAPLSGNKKMIKICVAGKDCTSGGATAQYYTVEVRTHYTASPGFDYYLQNEGVIIHYYWGDWTGPTHNSCYFNYQFGPAYPIDNFNVVPTPHYTGPAGSPACSEYVGSPYDPVGLRYANWNDGQTYSATGITIAIVSHTTAGGVTTYAVNVNGGTPSYAVTVASSPTGSGFVVVDGSPVTPPQVYSWAAGSTHTISAREATNAPFAGWSSDSSLSVSCAMCSAATVTVNGAGTVTANFGTAVSFDFRLSNSGASSNLGGVTIGRSSSGPISVTVVLVNGPAQTVTLSCSQANGSPLPSGVSCSPASGTPPFTATVTVTVSSSALPGYYTIKATGTAGTLTRTTLFTLVVT